MEITKELIEKLSDLAKLDFSKSEDYEKIKKDLERMLNFFAQISAVDTKNLPPLVHLIAQDNVLRDDGNCANIPQNEALHNAGFKDSDYFKAPKGEEG